MEIERKYLIHKIPFSLEGFCCRRIEQGYLCTEPVVIVQTQRPITTALITEKCLITHPHPPAPDIGPGTATRSDRPDASVHRRLTLPAGYGC